MKILRTTAALAVAALCVLTVPAEAAVQGTIGVYFDQLAVETNATKPVGKAFDLFVVLHSVDNQVQAVEYQVNLPSQLIVLNETYFPGSLVFGVGSNSGVQMGMGQCLLMFTGLQNEKVVLSTIRVMAISEFTAAQITVTKFPVPQPGVTMPRYTTCGANPVFFEVNSDTSTLSAAVPNDAPSWGSVKALFSE